MDRESHACDETRVATVMLRYLTEHPAAKDTVEGIATWWLRQERIEHAVETVRGALAMLVARDLLVEHLGPDLRTYYEINAGRMRDIAAFLGGAR
jgi:hypothetical protein